MNSYNSANRKEFEKVFQELLYRHDRSYCWSLFLTTCLKYFGRNHFMYPELAGPTRFQKQYDSEARRFNAEELALSDKLVGLLIAIYVEEIAKKGWTDYLGEFYTLEILSNGKAQDIGQFFTPEELCTLMAQQVLTDKTPTSETTIADCACGSGRTLIAACHALGTNGLFPYFYGTDTDWPSVVMASVNFVLHGMRGYIIRGNSLTLEYFTGFFIGGYVDQMNPFNKINMGIYPLSDDYGKEILGTTAQERHRHAATSVPFELVLNPGAAIVLD